MVDKSAAVIGAFRNAFDNVSIQLCLFHAKQAFQRKVRTDAIALGPIRTKHAIAIFSKMLYCESEQQYDDLSGELRGIGSAELTDYFTK